MKNLHICLSLTLSLICNSVFSQYTGGDGDGSEVYKSKLTYVDGVLREMAFMGGSGDGFSMERDSAIYLDGVFIGAPYIGGNGDGFSLNKTSAYFVDGTTIANNYSGGDGDGASNNNLNVQFLEGSFLASIFSGGDGDGIDFDNLEFQFLDGSTGCAIYAIIAGEPDSIDVGIYSQEITVSYIFDPGIGNIVINDQQFPITGSPQTVVLTGLPADGMPVDITAAFSDLMDCSFTEEALYIAPGGTDAIYPELGVPKIRFFSRPNPFTSQITFSVELEKAGHVSLELLNMNGQKIAQIFDENMGSNYLQDIKFDGTNLSQGIYLSRLNVDGHIYHQKLIKLK